MALTVENGTGVSGADSYAATATIDAYWTGRPQMALAATWAAATDAIKEGAAREASAYLDAVFGPFYRGTRAGYVQGLMWPRTCAYDESGYDLPNLPPELIIAACELAARSVSAPLADDVTVSGSVETLSVKVGPISESTTYADGARIEKKFGFLDGMLAPILDRAVPGSAAAWAWC